MSKRHPQPATMDIRPARIEDAGAVAALLGQLGYVRTGAAVRRCIRASASDPESAILVAAWPDGRLVGCLQAVVTRRLAEGDRGEIASLVVNADQRGRGIGAHLVRAAVEWLQARGIADLRVRCNVARARAHRFYERGGFGRTKTQPVFDRPLSPGRALATTEQDPTTR